MRITTLIESPDGNFEFTAELTEGQHRFLIEYAIRDLLTKGLIPFKETENNTMITVLPDITQAN